MEQKSLRAFLRDQSKPGSAEKYEASAEIMIVISMFTIFDIVLY